MRMHAAALRRRAAGGGRPRALKGALLDYPDSFGERTREFERHDLVFCVGVRSIDAKLGLEHLGPSTESIGVVHTSRAHVETTPPRRLRRQRRSLVAPWASAARGKSVGSPAQAAWPSLPSLRGWLAAKQPSGASNRRHRCRRSLRIAVRNESRVGVRQGAWEVAPRARGGFV